MKRCPECRRDYYDDTLLYCLDDGNALLEGPAKSEPPASAGGQFGSEAATRDQIQTTGQTAVLPSGNIRRSNGLDKRHVVVSLALVVIVFGVFFGYRYFASVKQIDSIAVMPFVNESGNADVEYLSDGLTETLINSLSQIPNLSVKARSSVFRYKGKEFDPKKIASELNVQAILTGRAVQRADQIALNLELIDARTENILWGNKYERKSADIVFLQSEIAKTLSEVLRSRLSDENLQKVTKSYTQNPEAYQAYLTGKFFSRQAKGDSSLRANEYYQRAVDADPNFALAWVELSQSYSSTGITKIMSAQEAVQKRSLALRRALELDPNLSEAHALNGWRIFNEWDFVGADKELQLAIELDPNSSKGHFWYSWLLATYGKFGAAIVECKKAQELDPFDAITNTYLGAWLIGAKRYDEASAQLKHTLEITPDYFEAHQWMATLFTYTGRYEEALREMDNYLELGKDGSELRRNLVYFAYLESVGYIKSLTGDKTPAEKALIELSQRYNEKGDVQETSLAVLCVAVGNRDGAFEWLEKGLQKRRAYMKFVKEYPFLDSLHDDPRFKDLLKRMNLPE